MTERRRESDFLDGMASASRRRLALARGVKSTQALEKEAVRLDPPPKLRLSSEGFDVIAELKLHSPSAGVLAAGDTDIAGRVEAYARGGAAAVSVLTEPDHFGGALAHLEEAARVLAPLGVPVMRKDFLVDPYQVLEARAAGAGGVLAIARMLDEESLAALVACALEQRMFVLVEAFDAAELAACGRLLAGFPDQADRVLVGLNCRDLRTLRIDLDRLVEARRDFPPGCLAVAESGLATVADAGRIASLGYRLALVGTALMGADDPTALLGGMLREGRRRHSGVPGQAGVGG